MQENKDSARNIFDVIDGASHAEETEFVFGKEPEEANEPSDAVVFDFGTAPATSKKKGDARGKSSPASAKTGLRFDDSVEERPKEFSVPDRFKVDERYNLPSGTEEAPRIITTYVPRFTDASRNYRMRDESTPRPEPRVKRDESHEAATREFDGDIDPTAELDENEANVSAVMVTKQTDDDPLTSASTVFKFDDGEPSSRSEVSETTKREEPVAEPPVTEEEPEPESEPRSYSIPDPEDIASGRRSTSSLSLASYGMVPEVAPRGVGDPLAARRGVREYDAISKRDGFKERFLDKILSVKVRFFAALAIALFALVFECIVASGVDLAVVLGIAFIPGAVAILDIHFTVALYLLTLPETVSAMIALARKRVTAELYLTAGLIVMIAYTAVIVVSAPIDYPLLGFLYSVYALSAIGASYFKASSDYTAFKRVSKNGEKLAADTKLTRTLERENVALDGKVEEYRSRTARTFRTLFVDDFINRSSLTHGRNSALGIVMGCALGLALVTGVIAYFIPGGWDYAASAFALVFLLACPALSILLSRLPLYHAEKEIDRQESAVIGEEALFEFAATDVFTFTDTEVFGSEDVSLQRINVNGHNDNLAKALRQMSALFMRVGGPLDSLFSNSLDRKCSPANDVEVYDEGIIGTVEGSRVYAGTREFMLEHGIKILSDTGEIFERQSDSTKIMYAAENGEAYAKFYIRYSFSEEFSMLLPILDDYGITPLVYTRDPNVSRRLLMTLTAGVDKIRVMKNAEPAVSDRVKYKSVSSSLVSTGDRTNVINSILIAKKYASLENRLQVFELISMAVGGVLAAVLSIGGMALVPSVALAAWHVIWCCALYFISKKSLRLDE